MKVQLNSDVPGWVLFICSGILLGILALGIAGGATFVWELHQLNRHLGHLTEPPNRLIFNTTVDGCNSPREAEAPSVPQ